MILGLLSDTHGRVEATAAGVEILRKNGAQFLIHCGDVGSIHVLDYLVGIPSAFVWGNSDYDRYTLEKYAQQLSIRCCGPFGELELDGKRIALLHGDDYRLRDRIIAQQNHDYLFMGHTHSAGEHRVGRTLVVNPGALHRATVKSVATVDTAGDTVMFLPLP